jgi:hypothetical protein
MRIGTHTQHRILTRIVLQPSEELRKRYRPDHVTTVWKWQKLGEELAEPRRAVRQVDVTRLNLRGRAVIRSTLLPSGLTPIGLGLP